jgi:hypothetical protein
MTYEYKGGMGFFGWLTLLFVGLKLTGYISWSWWWVLAPALVPVAILAAIALVAGAIYVWTR